MANPELAYGELGDWTPGRGAWFLPAMTVNYFGGGGGGLLIGLGGVLLGSVLTWITQHQLARRADRKERRLLLATKLEEAHEYILNARRQNIHLLMIMTNALRGTGSLHEPSDAPIDRLMTLLEIYAPSLSALNDKAKAASDARTELMIEFRDHEPEEPDARMEMAARFSTTLGAMDSAFLDLGKAVLRIVRGLIGDA